MYAVSLVGETELPRSSIVPSVLAFSGEVAPYLVHRKTLKIKNYSKFEKASYCFRVSQQHLAEDYMPHLELVECPEMGVTGG